MSNQDFDAQMGEHNPAIPAADAILQETSTKPVQFPLVMLAGGFAVHAKFMEVIRLQALDHIPLLSRDTPYKAADVLGKQFWQLLKKAEPKDAGRCITYLTQRDQLPLVGLGRGGDNHKRYMLK